MPFLLPRYFLLSCLACLLLLNSAKAQDPACNSWTFELTPVSLWGVEIDGDSTLGSSTAEFELDYRNNDLDDLDSLYGGRLLARKNEFTLFLEYQYFKLEPAVTIGPLQTDINFRNKMLELGASFEFSNSGSTSMESIFGFRYMDQKISNTGIVPNPPSPSAPDVNDGDQWWQPFMGIQIRQQLASRWSLLVRTDFAYAASDNKASNARALINFRVNQWGAIFAGYRYMHFDYDQGNGRQRYAFQADQQGPEIGLNFIW